MKVSLFASAVRPALFHYLFKSLQNTSVDYEVIFAGNAEVDYEYRNFKYIKTGNIKPAQCYEIARRNCIGDVIVWVADDCEFPNDVIGKAYAYWKSKQDEKLILSIQTRESGYNLPNGALFDMNVHRFFGGRLNTPLMAPLGMMSRIFLDDLGGIDCRYVCGQYENDIVMRAYNKGATVKVFGGKDCFIDIDHLGKSIAIKESTNQQDFLNRPFARGYDKDREVLENSWVDPNRPGNVLKDDHGKYIRNDQFIPYSDYNILTMSQSNKGHWQ